MRTNYKLIWLGPIFSLAAIAIILFSSAITVNAKKTTGQLRYQKKRLVGTQNSTCAIADVFRIETRKQWRMENTSSGNQGPEIIRSRILRRLPAVHTLLLGNPARHSILSRWTNCVRGQF